MRALFRLAARLRIDRVHRGYKEKTLRIADTSFLFVHSLTLSFVNSLSGQFNDDRAQFLSFHGLT